MSPIDPRRLETFRVVAQAGTISAAAKLLHLSQPAVTAQVKTLEEECGRALLTRGARGVVLNAWGLRLLEAARQIHVILGGAAQELQHEEEAAGELVLAASMTTAAYVIPPLLAGFRALHPAVGIRVEVANTAQVVERVADGRVALGMAEGLPRSPRLRLERYLPDELVLVAAESARAHHAITRAADLADAPVLLREPGSGSRAVVERAVQRALGTRRPLHVVLQLASNEAVKMAAMSGLGVAFLSRWSVQLELAAGKLRVLPLADLHITRSFSWALPSAVPGVAGRFLEWARRNPPALR
jgi:DNA-binding transcriptional LysR family regulator